MYYNLNIYELILVDLDSTDSTLQILKTFANDFAFVKVLTLEDYKILLDKIKKYQNLTFLLQVFLYLKDF